LSEDFSLKVLAYDDGSHPPQLGLDATALFRRSTIAFLEWTGGPGPTQEMQALGVGQRNAFHQRLATGFSYTTANNVLLTLEYEYNNAALDKAGLQQLINQSPMAYGQYLAFVESAQELSTKQAPFFYVGWKDAFVQHLDLSGFARYNIVDHSRLQWLEARYHWNRMDMAIQWQTDCGSPISEFGAAPQSSVWQVLLRYFY
jgi:hypothetical protein